MRAYGRLLLAGGMVLATVVACAGGAHADVVVDQRVQIVPRPDDGLQIWVWPDHGEGGMYYEDDPITLYIEANRDCFLILYDIDTRGHFRILFPADPWEDNFISAGETVSLPRPQDPFEWRVEGPPGTEYIQAIATEFPIPLPDWPVYRRSVNGKEGICIDPELRDFRCDDDPLDYIRVINRKITARFWDWCATDLATFYVHPRPAYHVGVVWDPWPDVFFGEIYIGWPVGGRIYIDGVYVGIAPLCVPRHYYGRHEITCYREGRLVQRRHATLYPKREYRYPMGNRPAYDVRAHGQVREALRGRPTDVDVAVPQRIRRPVTDRREPVNREVIRAPRLGTMLDGRKERSGDVPSVIGRSGTEQRPDATARVERQSRNPVEQRPDATSRVERQPKNPVGERMSTPGADREKRSGGGWLRSVAKAVVGVAKGVSTEGKALKRRPADKSKGQEARAETRGKQTVSDKPKARGAAKDRP